MLLTVVPDAAVQWPHEPMRNHQLLGPFDKLRSTDQSALRVAVRLGDCACATDGISSKASASQAAKPSDIAKVSDV